MNDQNRRMAVFEAAAYTGISISMLNKLRVSGGGPAFLKLGRRVLYDQSDLDEWMLGRRRRNTADNPIEV